MFYLFALFYGFAYGGFASSVAVLLAETVGLHQIGAIFGVVEIGFAVGSAVGPVIGGLIFDVSSSYFMAFLLGAVVMLVSTLLIALIRRETNRDFLRVGSQ